MPIILRTPDKKISLVKEEMQYLVAWLEACKTAAFTGTNNFNHCKDREELLQFSLLTFCEKLLTKVVNNHHQAPTKKFNLPVNSAEQIMLRTMFQRVDCDPYITAVQQKILLTLRPSYSSTEIERK